MCKKNNFTVSESILTYSEKLFAELIRKKDPETFGNAREVRNVFEMLNIEQNNRLSSIEDLAEKNDELFSEITTNDIINVADRFEISIQKKESWFKNIFL